MKEAVVNLDNINNSFVKTLNRMGYMSETLDFISQAFVDYCIKHSNGDVLEIGAAYGPASRRVVNEGKKIVANDIDERHLNILKQSICIKFRDNLEVCPGKFPWVSLKNSSFRAILACRVLHLLQLNEIIPAINKIYDLLKIGGKAYIVVDTPFLGIFKENLPIYEYKRLLGDPWPGCIEETSNYNKERSIDIPGFVNFMDLETLKNIFEKKFKIELASYINRKDFPDDLRFDGRESVGLIATKSC